MGTMAGYIIGNEMDKYNNQQLSRVYEQGQSGHPVSWNNPDSGHMYRVTPQAAVIRSADIC